MPPFPPPASTTASSVAKPRSAKDKQARLEQGKLEILVVDDAPEIRDYLTSILTLEGRFNVHAFSNGNDVVAYLETGRADLIFLDMELRGETGDQIARRIRALAQHRRAPILALTGHGGGEHRQKSLAAGCRDHLVKPITREAILAAIDKHSHTADAGLIEDSSTRLAEPEKSSSIAELIPAFLASRQRDVQRIPQLLDGNRFDDIRKLGHQLKGCGAIYGFDAISQFGDRIESAAAAGHRDELRSLALQLDHHLDELKASLGARADSSVDRSELQPV